MSENDCFVYKRANEIIAKLNKDDADFLRSIFDSLEKKPENKDPNKLPKEKRCSRYYLDNCVCCRTEPECPVETEIENLKRQIKEERRDLDNVLKKYQQKDFGGVYDILKQAHKRHEDKK